MPLDARTAAADGPARLPTYLLALAAQAGNLLPVINHHDGTRRRSISRWPGQVRRERDGRGVAKEGVSLRLKAGPAFIITLSPRHSSSQQTASTDYSAANHGHREQRTAAAATSGAARHQVGRACAYSTCSGPPRPDGWTGSADGCVCMCLHRIIKKSRGVRPSIHPAGRHVYFCFFFGRERCFFCGAAEGSKVGR
ncbi:hypothetical protein IWZ01DRAFT_187329 [Phyllosticta capitalensis]